MPVLPRLAALSVSIDRLFALPRRRKRAVMMFTDAVILLACFPMAMALRAESPGIAADPRLWLAPAIVVPGSIAVFARLGFYRAVIRFMESKAARAILWGALSSGVMLVAVRYALSLPILQSVAAIYTLLALALVGGARLGLRQIWDRSRPGAKTPVAIYGAGAAGRQLMVSLQRGRDHAPVAFIDDSPDLQGTLVAGIRVHPPGELGRLIESRGIGMVLLAMPGATRQRRAEVIAWLDAFAVQVRTVPDLSEILSGQAAPTGIASIAVEDLLGRDPVPPRDDLMEASIRGKSVLVTGAGGSIGSELCRQILARNPARLILFELSEYALYTIEQELQPLAARSGAQVVPLIGSVRDRARLETALHRFGVETMYHAAAYKHVPMVEANAVEGVANNVFGTLAAAEAAVAAGVREFILVSTDKAVRPTNIMGASKRMAELVCQAMSQTQSATRFTMVRFGNVLGSSGSVIPLFRRQIAAGGPVTVTHPDITRYFMTIPEAAQLVIQAGAMGRGGDVFVLDMGKPVRIADLARRMIRLSGHCPVLPGERATAESIAIAFTTLRPGEKLYEELLIGDTARPTAHPAILTADEPCLPMAKLRELLWELEAACAENDVPMVRSLLAAAPTGYRPAERIVDPLSEAGRPLPSGWPRQRPEPVLRRIY